MGQGLSFAEDSFKLPGYDLPLNSIGEEKGILTYLKNGLRSEKVYIKNMNVKITGKKYMLSTSIDLKK